MASDNMDIALDITDLRCEECESESIVCQGEFCPHLRSRHSADDQVLISSLLALAGEPSAIHVPEDHDTPANVYLCGECSSEFFSAEDCAKHVNLEHTKKNTEEDVEVKVIIEIQCDQKGCSYNFQSKEKLNRHKACHAEIGFKCFRGCDLVFKKWKKCSLHLWINHQIDLDLLSCSICPNLKVANQNELDVHYQIHSDDRKFECKICSKGFKQLSQLRNHSVTHMDKTRKTVPTWFAKKQCEICQKFFADSKCLKKHVQAVHSKLKPYICTICNHQSARKAMLEMHMRQHTGDKPYRCDECEYRTGDHNPLRRHKMRHNGDRPYTCSMCPYSSIQSAAFKRHMKSKHS